jgi:hypothetical protein
MFGETESSEQENIAKTTAKKHGKHKVAGKAKGKKAKKKHSKKHHSKKTSTKKS